MVVEGEVWYSGNQTIKTSDSAQVNEFILGVNPQTKDATFEGKLSEFNVWSSTLSLEEMKQITNRCGSVNPKPDILDWSNITESMIKVTISQKDPLP